MKILKIFGFVAGIHVFALILIFANPGCSSSSKPTPAPSDTLARGEPPSTVSLPMPPASNGSPMGSSGIAFNPDAPATSSASQSGGSSGGSSGGIRFVPTRPGTPVASTLQAAPVADVTPATTYTVKSGDTLWELGKKFHVPYAEIAAANNIRASAALKAGQKLIIPGKSTAASAPAATAGKNGKAAEKSAAAIAPGDSVRHVVKSGETLGVIARTYGVKQGDIAVANNIVDPAKIRAGMELVIPGWQAAGARTGTKSGTRATDSAAKSAATNAPMEEAASKPIFNLIEQAPPSGTPGGDVPIIKVEDSPLTPAPRGN